MGFKWDVEPGLAFGELTERYTQTIFTRLRFTADRQAAEMEQWAKANAPWTDRTGVARAGLHAVVTTNRLLSEIRLSHGDNVPYGVWLEIANAGKYAIIAPAIDRFSVIIWSDVQAQFRGIFNAVGNIGSMGNLNSP